MGGSFGQRLIAIDVSEMKAIDVAEASLVPAGSRDRSIVAKGSASSGLEAYPAIVRLITVANTENARIICRPPILLGTRVYGEKAVDGGVL